MNRKTTDYVRIVKNLTKEYRELIKKDRNLSKAFEKSQQTYYEEGERQAKEAEYDNLIGRICARQNSIKVQLAICKIAALRNSTKLSKSAKKAGFLTNDAYADFEKGRLLREYKDRLELDLEAHNFFNKGKENYREYFSIEDYIDDEIDRIYYDMNSKQASKIAKR